MQFLSGQFDACDCGKGEHEGTLHPGTQRHDGKRARGALPEKSHFNDAVRMDGDEFDVASVFLEIRSHGFESSEDNPSGLVNILYCCCHQSGKRDVN